MQVYAVAKNRTDGALAARLGQPLAAATLLAEALKKEPADLLTHAALASFGQPTMVDWKVARDVEEQTLRLELLAGLEARPDLEDELALAGARGQQFR